MVDWIWLVKCMTNRQIANHARMSLDKFMRSGDIQHLKDAHEILSEVVEQELEKDEQLTDKVRNYS